MYLPIRYLSVSINVVYTCQWIGDIPTDCCLLGWKSLQSEYKCTDVSEEPTAKLEYLPVYVYHISISDLSVYSCGSLFP
jgi:hypothetical protein